MSPHKTVPAHRKLARQGKHYANILLPDVFFLSTQIICFFSPTEIRSIMRPRPPTPAPPSAVVTPDTRFIILSAVCENGGLRMSVFLFKMLNHPRMSPVISYHLIHTTCRTEHFN